jgi:nicotinamide-nucleotide amidase
MAEGALARSDAAIALAVTGFAGPTLTEGEEGQVHFAVASQLGPAPATSHLYRAFGPLGRDRIRALCLETLIEMLEDATP